MLLNEPFLERRREAAEAWFALARLNFATLERLTALAFNAHKSAFEDAVANAHALLNARKPEDLVKANLAVAPEAEKALAHWRSIFDVALQWQNEMTRVLQSQAALHRESMGSLVPASDPATGGTTVFALQAALTAAGRGCEALRLISDMAGGVAEAGFTAAMEGLKAGRS